MCGRYSFWPISHADKLASKQYIPIFYFMLQKYIVQRSHQKKPPAHDLKHDNKDFSNRAVEHLHAAAYTGKRLND